MMPPTAKRGVRPKDLYLLRTVVDPQVSPDGKRVAYVVTWPDRDADETRMSVYIASTDGRARARRFTQGNKDHTPRWSPDGRHLAFVSDRGEKNQLFVAPGDEGEAWDLESGMVAGRQADRLHGPHRGLQISEGTKPRREVCAKGDSQFA